MLTRLFCEIDDCCQGFLPQWEAHVLEQSSERPKRNRPCGLSLSISAYDGVLFHSDQGCQYSHAYQEKLTELGIKANMSRRGNCWDNAVMEHFFRILKVEAINRDHYQTADEISWAVKKYIHFYNTKHIRSANEAITPNQAKQLFLKPA